MSVIISLGRLYVSVQDGRIATIITRMHPIESFIVAADSHALYHFMVFNGRYSRYSPLGRIAHGAITDITKGNKNGRIFFRTKLFKQVNLKIKEP